MLFKSTDIPSVASTPATNNTRLKYVSKYRIYPIAKLLCRSTNGIPFLRASAEWFLMCLPISLNMNMSSQGTFAVCNNRNISSDNEANVCSTENNYSLTTFSAQAEVFNPKIMGKAKFNKNKKARRTQTRKDLRKSGNPHNVPKKESNQKKQNKSSRYTHQSSIEYVHQSLLEHIYPASIGIC